MAASEDILVSDLNKMSAKELRERRLITLKDPENLTAEHMERLKLLVNGLDESRALDVDAIDEKLRNLNEVLSPGAESRSSSSSTPDPDDPVLREEDRLNSLRWEHEAYHELVRNGGQPSHHPNDSGFDYLYQPQTGIIWYWITVCPSRECIFQEQRWYWEKFRKYQDWRRWRYWKPQWFERFVQIVREYRQKKGLEGDIQLLQDRQEQSRLQDWVEFQYWESKKADRFVSERERFTEEVKCQEKKLQAAIEADQPAEEIEWIRDYSLASMKAGQGSAEIELERQNVLLKWIGEQLPIIALECRGLETGLEKRKRSTDQDDHMEDSRRRVSNKSSEARADDDHTAPVHRTSEPEQTNSLRRNSTIAAPVQAQRENRQSAATPAEEVQSIALGRVHSAKTTSRGDARASPRKGKDAMKRQRQKQPDPDATVRRSSRLAGKPAVRYRGLH